jgi:hypothetical protein
MKINDPAIVAEVTAAFERYEAAFVANDMDMLDAFFVTEPTTVRYGVAENQYGIDALRAYRKTVVPVGLERRLVKTRITTYGDDCAVASTLFYRDATPGRVGRQMQTWVRTDGGWRVAAAHVSVIDEPE